MAEPVNEIRRMVIKKAVLDKIRANGESGIIQLLLFDILKDSIPDLRPSEFSTALFRLKEENAITSKATIVEDEIGIKNAMMTKLFIKKEVPLFPASINGQLVD